MIDSLTRPYRCQLSGKSVEHSTPHMGRTQLNIFAIELHVKLPFFRPIFLYERPLSGPMLLFPVKDYCIHRILAERKHSHEGKIFGLHTM